MQLKRTDGRYLSPKMKARLKEDELIMLQHYIDNTPDPYVPIKKSVNVSRDIVCDTLARGWATINVAVKLRIFIASLR